MRKLFYLPFFLLSLNFVIAQDSGVGINTTNPQGVLDVVSTESGILIPRMTSVEKLSILSPITSMLVFDTTLQSFSYYDGISWVILGKQNLQETTDLGNTTTNLIKGEGGFSTNWNYGYSQISTELVSGMKKTDIKTEGNGNEAPAEVSSRFQIYPEFLNLNGINTETGNSAKLYINSTNGTIDVRTVNTNFKYNSEEVATVPKTIPITGTSIENPITGDLEFDTFVSEKKIKGSFGSSITFPEASYPVFSITSPNGSNVFSASNGTTSLKGNIISLQSNGGGPLEYVYIDSPSSTRGIVASNNHSANIQANDYPQKNYVDSQHSYSTTEKLTGGTWIDNKPIYMKVIPAPDTSYNITIPHGIVGLDNIISAKLNFFQYAVSRWTSLNLSMAVFNYGLSYIDNTNVSYENQQGEYITNVFFIIEYTKS